MEDIIIDIKGISRAKVLSVLYNNAMLSIPQMYYPHKLYDMTEDEAEEYIPNEDEYGYDHVRGRRIKVFIVEDKLNLKWYLKYNPHVDVNKLTKKLKQDLKCGVAVDGAHLEQGETIVMRK